MGQWATDKVWSQTTKPFLNVARGILQRHKLAAAIKPKSFQRACKRIPHISQQI
jgi:phage protein D